MFKLYYETYTYVVINVPNEDAAHLNSENLLAWQVFVALLLCLIYFNNLNDYLQ